MILVTAADLPADAAGYQFFTPVLKEREYRLDGLFLPPRERPDLPVVIMEAQLASDPDFFMRLQAAGTALAAELNDVITAIVVSRFSGRSIPELCAMGGITLEDFTQSVARREIFGLGEASGEARGKAEGEATVTLRLLQRRCGLISPATEATIRSLALERLELLADALLDFNGPADLAAWLEQQAA